MFKRIVSWQKWGKSGQQGSKWLPPFPFDSSLGLSQKDKKEKKNLMCQFFQFYILHSTFHVYSCIVYASSLEDFKSHSHRNLEFCPFPEELTPKSLLIFFLWLEKYDKLNRELIWRGFGWLPAGSKGLHTATASQVVLTTILIFC